MQLQSEIEATQQELVFRLSEALEQRSTETGNHVKRVSHICYELAMGYGYQNAKQSLIRLAAPLHDVGKVGIPDAILNKPGPLTDEEWAIMKQHAEKGHLILKDSQIVTLLTLGRLLRYRTMSVGMVQAIRKV